MIPNCKDIMYIFNLDSSIFVTTGELMNIFKYFLKIPTFNPTETGIRWILITKRKRYTKFIIWILLRFWGMTPIDIYFYDDIKNKDLQHGVMMSLVRDIYMNKHKYCSKIYYIDNNITTISLLNKLRFGFPIRAITLNELLNTNFSIL